MNAVFRSRVDRALGAGLALASAVELVGACVVALAPGPGWARIVLPTILAASGLLVGWCLLGTAYAVDGDTLRVRSGPFRWRVPVSEIEDVVPVRSRTAAPALSRERVEVRLAGGRAALQLSPADRSAFVAALRSAGAGGGSRTHTPAGGGGF
jgi:hypothetical protein